MNQNSYVDNPFKSPAVISFCPGVLGLERGLARAGVNCRVVAYVEIEAFIIANLVAGMEAGVLDTAPIWTDAKTFDARPFRGKIHGIIGGYPCPGESLAGLREGHLYKGFIWPSIRRTVAAAKPLWCYFENVDDHLTGTYPIVQRSLRNMGYAVEAGIFSTEEAGGSCERQRLFILAIAKGARIGGLSKCESGQEWGQQEQGVHIDRCGEELGGTIGTRLEKRRKQSTRKELSPIERRGYPMGKGFTQFEWEPPRLESSLVYHTSGYNFREDLVRAIGNSVDENVAQKAFVTLLNKHINNSI